MQKQKKFPLCIQIKKKIQLSPDLKFDKNVKVMGLIVQEMVVEKFEISDQKLPKIRIFVKNFNS